MGVQPQLKRQECPLVINGTNPFLKELCATAKQMSTPGRGILAADESTGTIGKRFAMINVENNEENRRRYRELLFTTEGLEQHISGVIMFEETTMHKTTGGQGFCDLLRSKGILCGIKVDKGQAPIPGTDGETFTKGLDDLHDMCKRNYERGCRFAKWRSVIRFGNGRPSEKAIREVAYGLAQYASICQMNGLCPIVEPECTMDGEHGIERCAQVSEAVFSRTFQALNELNVCLEGMVLKPNMITRGKQSSEKTSPKMVAEMTLRTLARTVPSAVPGIFFLSGGQSEEEASLNLNAMNAMQNVTRPWYLSFSYGRALQFSCLQAWQGKSENRLAAQKVLLARAQANGEATLGKYAGTTDENAKRELYEKNYVY